MLLRSRLFVCFGFCFRSLVLRIRGSLVLRISNESEQGSPAQLCRFKAKAMAHASGANARTARLGCLNTTPCPCGVEPCSVGQRAQIRGRRRRGLRRRCWRLSDARETLTVSPADGGRGRGRGCGCGGDRVPGRGCGCGCSCAGDRAPDRGWAQVTRGGFILLGASLVLGYDLCFTSSILDSTPEVERICLRRLGI